MKKTKLYATQAFKRKREELGYTQAEVADWLTLELGMSISLSLVQKWEQKIKPMNANIAVRVAGLLKMPIGELVEKK